MQNETDNNLSKTTFYMETFSKYHLHLLRLIRMRPRCYTHTPTKCQHYKIFAYCYFFLSLPPSLSFVRKTFSLFLARNRYEKMWEKSAMKIFSIFCFVMPKLHFSDNSCDSESDCTSISMVCLICIICI